MRKVVTRAKTDVGGKPVDQIFLTPTAFMYVFNADECASAEVELRALEALRSLAQSRNARSKRRDFVILLGAARNSQGKNCLCLCLPDVSAQVTKHFSEAFQQLPRYDTGTHPLGDLELAALARYIDGSIIIYMPPSVAAGSLPHSFEAVSSWGVRYETRSSQLEQPRVAPPRYATIPEGLAPEGVRGERHTLEDHHRISKSLDSIIRYSANPMLGAPFGYKQLRSFCARRLGIHVHEDYLPDNCSGLTGVGAVRVDEGDVSTRVMIRLNRALPAEIKYVALAHELAHYRLHFPWLLVSRLGFDLALRVPETAVILDNFLRAKGDMAEMMERQADIYSSYLILPPYADNLDVVAGNMYLEDRPPAPEELAWKFLTPFFPNESVGGSTWKAHHLRNRQAADALSGHSQGLAPASLMERYFSAMVRRLRREYDSAGGDMSGAAAELMSLLSPPVNTADSFGVKVRSVIRVHAQRGEWRMPTSTEEFMELFAGLVRAHLGQGDETRLEVIPRRGLPTDSPIHPVKVLIPLRRVGAGAGRKLVALPGTSRQGAATIEEWLKRLPDHGLIVADVSTAVQNLLKKDAADNQN